MVDYETLVLALVPIVGTLFTLGMWFGILRNEQKNQSWRLDKIETELREYSIKTETQERILELGLHSTPPSSPSEEESEQTEDEHE